MRLQRLLNCVFILVLAACGSDPELPPVKALATAPHVIDSLYAAKTGHFDVKAHRDLSLAGTSDERQLELNLYFPEQGSNFPLLLFSHGNWSNKDSYDHIIEHWVSHGYAVIAANHLDCCSAPLGIFNSLRYGQVGLVEARIADLSQILRQLPELERNTPGFAGKADISRLAITGHSFGAFTAQQLGGAQAFDPDKDAFLSHLDSRVKAVVALSPPGPMFDTITENSWKTLSAPTLISTGTWDVQASFWPDWRAHLMSWETALPQHKYALVIEGADHYLGNLICRLEREASPQKDALRMVQIATTAFLDAHLKAKNSAQHFIASDAMGEITKGFATLSVR